MPWHLRKRGDGANQAKFLQPRNAFIDQLFNPSENALPGRFFFWRISGSKGIPEPKIAKITQETLAQMIGTARLGSSFFMNKFRKLGFISYYDGIEVHSSLLNVVLRDQPHIEP